jgi:hypothetical protein
MTVTMTKKRITIPIAAKKILDGDANADARIAVTK